jgi:hypothetical protein
MDSLFAPNTRDYQIRRLFNSGVTDDEVEVVGQFQFNMVKYPIVLHRDKRYLLFSCISIRDGNFGSLVSRMKRIRKRIDHTIVLFYQKFTATDISFNYFVKMLKRYDVKLRCWCNIPGFGYSYTTSKIPDATSDKVDMDSYVSSDRCNHLKVDVESAITFLQRPPINPEHLDLCISHVILKRRYMELEKKYHDEVVAKHPSV